MVGQINGLSVVCLACLVAFFFGNLGVLLGFIGIIISIMLAIVDFW